MAEANKNVLFALSVMHFGIRPILNVHITESISSYLVRAPSKSHSLMNVLMLRVVTPFIHRQTAC